MHILVAEDHPINQKVVAKLLSRLGNCTFSLVGDGQQVLEYLAGPTATCPRPDLILMDTAMPIMDGLHATSIIRTSPPFANNPSIATIPIVAVTASSTKQEQEMFRQRGFDDIITKPIYSAVLKGLLEFWGRSRIVLLPDPGSPGGVRRRIVTEPPVMGARAYRAKSVI
ncbi:CheY-like superfamily [Aspergillus pseudodeflectus]|uniref:CheY-like superfamily n=1 Tax=Aspergillus pseudodeflectus TaxID=176178 RepID=A0ABR4KSK7_9EURO